MKNSNRNLLIAKIVILTVIALLLLGIMIILLNKENLFSTFFHSKSTTIYENSFAQTDITEINIEGISSDVSVEESATDKIEVIAMGEDKEEIDVSVLQNSLQIKKERYQNLCFGFCTNIEDDITVKIPQNYTGKVTIKTSSGDNKIASLSKINMKLKTTSGDIEVQEANDLQIETTSGEVGIIQASVANVETTSGDIDLGSITSKITLETTSGDIDIKSLALTKNSSIKTRSGDVDIERMSDVYIETKTTSGDEEIKAQNNRYANQELRIETTSGDITVENN